MEGGTTYLTFYFQFPDSMSDPQNTNITMMIETNQPYWFGWGLGPGMTGPQSDIWLFNISETRYIVSVMDSMNITPVDCFGLNYSGAAFDVDFNGQNNLNLLGYSYTPELSRVKFSRLLDTGTF